MKYALIIFLAFIGFSCKKESQYQSRAFKYVYRCNHLPVNGKVCRSKYGNPVSDFWDTVTVSYSEKQITENVADTDFPMKITMTSTILNDFNIGDSVFVELYCDGIKINGAPNVMMDSHHSDYTFIIEAK